MYYRVGSYSIQFEDVSDVSDVSEVSDVFIVSTCGLFVFV